MLTTYTGWDYPLATTARYVMFLYHNTTGGGVGSGYYTDRNERSMFSLQEVRFQAVAAAVPERSTLILAVCSLLGLVACGRRRNRRRA